MLVRRWLDAAGITEPVLRECYTVCARRVMRDRVGVGWVGTLATPAPGRPYAVAVATLLLEADDRVDSGPPEGRLQRIDEWIDAWYTALEAGGSSDPVLHAAAHACSVAVERPSRALMDEVFAALRSDFEFTAFRTYEDWRVWAAGSTSATLVWIMSLWGALGDDGESIIRGYGELGQLVDCLADVCEDLREGRLYLPLEDLDRFGVRRQDLEAGRWTAATEELIAFEVARITSRLPVLLERARQHPWLYPIGSGFDEFLGALSAAVLEAGPAVLYRAAAPATGPTIQAGLKLWRSALVA